MMSWRYEFENKPIKYDDSIPFNTNEKLEVFLSCISILKVSTHIESIFLAVYSWSRDNVLSLNQHFHISDDEINQIVQYHMQILSTKH